MNKILVVAKNPETYFIKRLIEEVGPGRLCLFNPWKDGPPTGFSRIIVRTTGVYGSGADLEFLKTCPVPALNPLESHILFRAKSSQYKFYSEHSHPAPPWWWLDDWVPGDEALYLVKPDYGQGGWGIQVLTPKMLLAWREKKRKENDLSWIVQPYIEAPEYRVFFMGNERLTLERIPNESQVAANFSLAGAARLVETPALIKDTVERLISSSGAYYGAVDLFATLKGGLVLELNVAPGIEQLEKITGINIIKQLLTANYFCQMS